MLFLPGSCPAAKRAKAHRTSRFRILNFPFWRVMLSDKVRHKIPTRQRIVSCLLSILFLLASTIPLAAQTSSTGMACCKNGAKACCRKGHKPVQGPAMNGQSCVGQCSQVTLGSVAEFGFTITAFVALGLMLLAAAVTLQFRTALRAAYFALHRLQLPPPSFSLA